MITSWVLVLYIALDRSGGLATIQNLKSLDECNRVAEVMKQGQQWGDPRITKHRCVEVINK